MVTRIENVACKALATGAVDAGNEPRCHRVSAATKLIGMLDVAALLPALRHCWRSPPLAYPPCVSVRFLHENQEELSFTYFPENYRWSHGLLIGLNMAPWGGAEIGEVNKSN